MSVSEFVTARFQLPPSPPLRFRRKLLKLRGAGTKTSLYAVVFFVISEVSRVALFLQSVVG